MPFKKIALVLGLCLCLAGILPADTALAQTASKEDTLNLGQAAVLGVVEGLTEYLPVSSTGHLLLATRIMGLGENGATKQERESLKEAFDAYTICIQAGAIIAVLGLYFRRVRQMLRGLMGKDSNGLQLLINIAAGFVPAAVIGLLFNKTIKTYLFGTWPVVIAWFVGGVAILAVNARNKNSQKRPGSCLSLEELSWKMALFVGFAQCIAMWPGVSRSLATIVGGMLAGLSMAAAVEFSFLLGVVTLSAATAYDVLKHGSIMLETFAPLSLATGLLFAFVSAVFSVKWMVSYLNRHGLALFGYYRVALSLVAGTLLLTGML